MFAQLPYDVTACFSITICCSITKPQCSALHAVLNIIMHDKDGPCMHYVLVTILISLYTIEWITEYREPFIRNCKNNEAFFGFQSRHLNLVEDRIYYFQCIKISRKEHDHCYWTKLNNHNENIDSQCESGMFVAGIDSTYDSSHKDRDFRMFCCRNSEIELTSCRKTPQNINNLNLYFSFTLEGNKIFTGFESKHDNGEE